VLHGAGVIVLLAAMALVWVADIAAYFAGRRFGRRRLAPAISPGKTWEGVIGALAGVLLYGLLLQQPLLAGSGIDRLHTAAGAGWYPLLLVLAVLGIEGDLLESWLKRCAGVKDSGWVLPGHGGVIDRIDALTAALPAAAWLVLQCAPRAVA
jgi:phosphatidate cytidylyltransferase